MLNKLIIPALFSLILLYGCTKENLSDCGGVEIAFVYDHHAEGIDKFPTDVDKINVYVFDENGLFVGEYIDAGAHLDNHYRMRLNIKPGVYDFVVWGNLRNDYLTTSLTTGLSTTESFHLMLKSDNGTVSSHPKPLYYGALMRVNVTSVGSQLITISLINNTNYIKAIFKGLPAEGATKATADGRFYCRLIGENGSYSYDNSLRDNTKFIYTPKYGGDIHSLSVEYVTMRLFDDNSCKTRLLLEYRPTPDSESQEILNVRLTDAIKAQYPDVDFDRDDTFILPFEVNGTNGNFTITINGWTATGNGQVIG